MSFRTAAGGIAVAAILVSPVVSAPAAQAAVPAKYKNCTALHKYYKHGVGKAGAKDKTSGRRVTNFTHSTKIYKAAIRANKGLDRDRDGIACEA
jgi:uncharacterized membrane protein